MLLSEGLILRPIKVLIFGRKSSERLQKHGRPLDAVSLPASFFFVSRSFFPQVSDFTHRLFFLILTTDSGGRVDPFDFTPNLPS